jgi:nicotinate-nucleotide pyrophosphorylase (carboxylating)
LTKSVPKPSSSLDQVSHIDGALPQLLIDRAVEAALLEDLGLSGDITSVATVSPTAQASGVFRSRADGVISGLPVARETFLQLDKTIVFEPAVQDGARVSAGDVIAKVSGLARPILMGERVALNFLGRMSGIATLTRRYADLVAGTNAKIADTRKTTPGLRAFEKYAVRCGGGSSHRAGLFDAILIKDNHIVAAGGVAQALKAARAHAGHTVKVEIEVDTLEQLKTVLEHGADIVLLDNMPPETLRKAVAMIGGKAISEASGGVNMQTVRAIAETGVDMISVGALTHSAPVLDLGLDFTL